MFTNKQKKSYEELLFNAKLSDFVYLESKLHTSKEFKKFLKETGAQLICTSNSFFESIRQTNLDSLKQTVSAIELSKIFNSSYQKEMAGQLGQNANKLSRESKTGGYFGILVKHPDFGIVLANIGTRPDAFYKDLMTDAAIFFNINDLQYKYAVNFAEYCFKKYAQNNELINFTGHSKGGNLADLQAAVLGGNSTTFDRPALSEAIRKKYVRDPGVSSSYFSVQSNTHIINSAGGKNGYADVIYVNPAEHQSLNQSKKGIELIFSTHSLKNIIVEIEQKRFYQTSQQMFNGERQPNLPFNKVFHTSANKNYLKLPFNLSKDKFDSMGSSSTNQGQKITEIETNKIDKKQMQQAPELPSHGKLDMPSCQSIANPTLIQPVSSSEDETISELENLIKKSTPQASKIASTESLGSSKSSKFTPLSSRHLKLSKKEKLEMELHRRQKHQWPEGMGPTPISGTHITHDPISAPSSDFQVSIDGYIDIDGIVSLIFDGRKSKTISKDSVIIYGETYYYKITFNGRFDKVKIQIMNEKKVL